VPQTKQNAISNLFFFGNDKEFGFNYMFIGLFFDLVLALLQTIESRAVKTMLAPRA
jgi:hypothetical protein